MAKYTLTAAQRDAIDLLIKETAAEQAAVATYEANVTAGKSRRDACHRKLKNALAELGHTARLPATITAMTKDLEPDGSWAGKITVT